MAGESGTKNDCEKARTDLLPVVPLLGAATVFGFGAEKYGEFNYRGGIKHRRLYGACLRHLFEWYERRDIDPESGLPHLDHALCSLMMLRQMTHERPDLDDRYKPETQTL